MLNEYELEVAKELISIALANSADAFSKMAMEKVLVEKFSIEIQEGGDFIVEIDQETPTVNVLLTEVKGALLGKSYLIFNFSDLEKVISIFSKEKLENNEPNEFQKAILLELDNIVSAAMVTQVSNLLGVFTYGDVPSLHNLTHKELEEMIGKDLKTYDVALKVKAQFKSYKTYMQPSFIWLFKNDFLIAIHELVKKKKHLSLIKEK